MRWKGLKHNYKIGLVFIVLLISIWTLEAAIHVVFFHKQNFFREVFTIEVHELWMRLFAILIAAVMGFYIQSLVNRQKVLKVLKQSEERLRGICEAMFEGIAILEGEKIVDANHQFAEMLGYRQYEIIGKSIMNYIAPESLGLVRQHLKEDYQGVCGYTAVKKDRSLIHVEVRGRQTSGSDHTRRELVFRDITEHRHMEKRLLEMEERERQRIGQDLHDGLGQLLSGIAFKCQALESLLEKKLPAHAAQAAEVAMLAEQAKAQARHLTQGLLPVKAEQEGLMVALKELADDTRKLFELSCTFRCNEPVAMQDETVVIHLYRIAQEAVNNAVKHGRPGQIDISLDNEHGHIVMVISDNGTGMKDAGTRTNGMGLKIMNYRANMIGASLDIQSSRQQGTRVVCSVSDSAVRQGAEIGDAVCGDKTEEICSRETIS